MGNKEQKRSKITVLNEKILGDKTLTLAEKIVYARICYFDEFFESAEATAEYLGIGASVVKRAKRTLEKKGNIICVKDSGRGKVYVADVNYGMWQKNNADDVTDLSQQVCQNCNTRPTKIVTSGVQNCHSRVTNLSHIDIDIEKNIGKNEDKEKLNKKKKFVKPSVEEIQAYCDEKGYTLDAEKFYDYYESVGWKRGKSPVKDWKATVRTWARNAKEWGTDKASSREVYKPADTEDITYKRMFDKWKQYLGVGLPETREQVEACKALLDDLGEEGLERLIVALRMRSQHSYLTKDITGVKDFVGLRENGIVVQNFYDKHWREWKRWAENEKLGKKRWEL